MNDGSANKAEPPTSHVNFRSSDIELGEQAPDSEPPSPSVVTLESQPMPFHTLILDLAGVCFIDLMGIKVLIKVRSLFAILDSLLKQVVLHSTFFKELLGFFIIMKEVLQEVRNRKFLFN